MIAALTTCSPATVPVRHLQFPSMGSVVSHEFGPRNNLPPYVCIPSQPNTHAGTGYLSSSFAPFSLGSDPASSGFKVRDLNLPSGIDDQDGSIDGGESWTWSTSDSVEQEESDALDAVDTFYERAYSMISSQKAREAFDISKEPAKRSAINTDVARPALAC